MSFKKFRLAVIAPVVALAGLIEAAPAAVTTPAVAGWTFDHGSQVCAMRQQEGDSGIWGVGLGLDEDGNAERQIRGIYLRLPSSKIDDETPVDLIHTVGGRKFTFRATPMPGRAFRGEFTSPVSADYLALLETSSRAVVSDPNGRYLFGTELKNYPQALAALRICIKQVESEFWKGRDGW